MADETVTIERTLDLPPNAGKRLVDAAKKNLQYAVLQDAFAAGCLPLPELKVKKTGDQLVASVKAARMDTERVGRVLVTMEIGRILEQVED